jgi:glycosyltransferase involved in cell wall biosynthesis
VRVLIDYRPALRERTGVGEYVLGLVEALPETAAACGPISVTVFSSSWKDRLERALPMGVSAIDLKWPVAVLNALWHRCGWPAIETLTGRRFDVAHAPHPLLIPTRDAAQIVTVHDLDFLEHPERTRDEIRRDYPRLVRWHAQRADRVVVPSHYTARRVQHDLGVPSEKISVCVNGAPNWPARSVAPTPGHLLFVGAVSPRKNVGLLLEAYGRLLARRRDAPDLVLAGSRAHQEMLEPAHRPPLAGRVRMPGYVSDEALRQLYAEARLLILPSLDEGFGRPVLEAMTMGVPVVASARGAIPEIVGDAGLLFDPTDPEALVAAIERLLADPRLAASLAQQGLVRARRYSWHASAMSLREAYDRAVESRNRRAR